MTKRKPKLELVDVKEFLERDEDFLRAALEAEMTETLGAAKGERSATRLAYRSGYHRRSLITRVGILELQVPQDRAGRFSTELFERYQRSEKALVGTLAEMYVQGASTRKVTAVTEVLAGTASRPRRSARRTNRWDEALGRFAEWRLEEAFPCPIIDARHEKVR
jgi:putative transposase